MTALHARKVTNKNFGYKRWQTFDERMTNKHGERRNPFELLLLNIRTCRGNLLHGNRFSRTINKFDRSRTVMIKQFVITEYALQVIHHNRFTIENSVNWTFEEKVTSQLPIFIPKNSKFIKMTKTIFQKSRRWYERRKYVQNVQQNTVFHGWCHQKLLHASITNQNFA